MANTKGSAMTLIYIHMKAIIDQHTKCHLLTQQIHIWRESRIQTSIQKQTMAIQMMSVKTFLFLPTEENKMRHGGYRDSSPNAGQKNIMMALEECDAMGYYMV